MPSKRLRYDSTWKEKAIIDVNSTESEQRDVYLMLAQQIVATEVVTKTLFS